MSSRTARYFQGPSPLPIQLRRRRPSRSPRNRLINLPLLPPSEENYCPVLSPPASASRLNPNWVGLDEQPNWGLVKRIGKLRGGLLPCVPLLRIGKAKSTGLSLSLSACRRSRVMKLKNSAAMFRETGPIVVQKDYGVRPNKPDIVQTRCRWIIGDVTEVLDHNTWKLGKIAKIVENNYFVIRLADCIQLKEFHISSLRVPIPQDLPTATVQCKQFPAANQANRRGKQLPADVLRRSGKKRKSSAVLDSPPQPRHRRFVSQQFQNTAAGEEIAECSVASCSANDDVCGSSRQRCCSVGRGDAISVVAAPCTSSSSSSALSLSDGPAMDVHELELEAYRSTVRALHASGPLTWEQESLLTNLRLSLNISNEEHLLQLRRLLSS